MVRYPPPRPDLSPSTADRRAGPKVMRVGDLVPSLASCSTRESGPCTLLVQYRRAGPDGDCMGEPALRV